VTSGQKTSWKEMENEIKQAARLLRNAKKAIALTGAGASTESGIPDFRSKDGLWSRYDPMEYGTISAFRSNPEKVWKMLAELMLIVDAQPNPGHLALARLEQQGILTGIITQNIDLLHTKGGSKNVVEFHGSINSLSCLDCGTNHPYHTIQSEPAPPACPHCQSLLKPDVVFFDEQIPPEVFTRAQSLLQNTDCLLVAGTSCSVIPASLIPSQVYGNGGTIIELNLEPALGHMASVVLEGGFSSVMQRLAEHFS